VYFLPHKSATKPHEQHAKHYTQQQVSRKRRPFALCSEQPHIISKRRKRGEPTAKTRNKQNILAVGHYAMPFQQSEKQAYHQAAKHIHEKRAQRELTMKQHRAPASNQIATARADKSSAPRQKHCFHHNITILAFPSQHHSPTFCLTDDAKLLVS
jgi:hypothetical protein